jgi:UbiD family decarboxylase
MLWRSEWTRRRDQFFEFVRRFRLPGELERVASAPWQEVTVDKDINLYELLPLFRLNRGDGGYYIDKACIISRDPDDWDNDDVENVGVYRLMVQGPNRIGIQPVPQHDIAIHLSHAEARGEDLTGDYVVPSQGGRMRGRARQDHRLSRHGQNLLPRRAVIEQARRCISAI